MTDQQQRRRRYFIDDPGVTAVARATPGGLHRIVTLQSSGTGDVVEARPPSRKRETGVEKTTRGTIANIKTIEGFGADAWDWYLRSSGNFLRGVFNVAQFGVEGVGRFGHFLNKMNPIERVSFKVNFKDNPVTKFFREDVKRGQQKLGGMLEGAERTRVAISKGELPKVKFQSPVRLRSPIEFR